MVEHRHIKEVHLPTIHNIIRRVKVAGMMLEHMVNLMKVHIAPGKSGSGVGWPQIQEDHAPAQQRLVIDWQTVSDLKFVIFKGVR